MPDSDRTKTGGGQRSAPRGGPPKRTPEFVEAARALRAQGWMLKQIGAELGASETTVRNALKHGAVLPPEHRSAVGRDLWRDRMFGGEDREIWNRARIIGAIRAWEKRTGRLPSSRQWERPNGRGNKGSGISDPRPPSRPTTSTVKTYFGTWNAAIEAAGLTPRQSGGSHGGSRKNGRCKRGHNVNIVGTGSGNRCKECNRLRERKYRERRRRLRRLLRESVPDKRFRVNGRCKHGHDVNIVGLTRDGRGCGECKRISARRRYRERKSAASE